MRRPCSEHPSRACAAAAFPWSLPPLGDTSRLSCRQLERGARSCTGRGPAWAAVGAAQPFPVADTARPGPAARCVAGALCQGRDGFRSDLPAVPGFKTHQLPT